MRERFWLVMRRSYLKARTTALLADLEAARGAVQRLNSLVWSAIRSRELFWRIHWNANQPAAPPIMLPLAGSLCVACPPSQERVRTKARVMITLKPTSTATRFVSGSTPTMGGRAFHAGTRAFHVRSSTPGDHRFHVRALSEDTRRICAMARSLRIGAFAPRKSGRLHRPVLASSREDP